MCMLGTRKPRAAELPHRRIMYAVVAETKSGNKQPYMAYFGNERYHLGVWYTAKRNVGTWRIPTNYEACFHVFRTIDGAREWKYQWYGTMQRSMCIVRVEVRNICVVGVTQHRLYASRPIRAYGVKQRRIIGRVE